MQIMTNDFKKAEFTGKIIECSKSERTRAGLKKMFSFWLAALVSIFIPVLHFVLVPLFFFLGVGFFFYQLKQIRLLSDLGFKCPDCGGENKISKMYFKDVVRLRCNQCSVQLILS